MSHAFKGLGLAVLCLAGWQSASATPPVASSPIDSLNAQVWREECGACHVAFPPRLLPSSSWADIMRNLKDHFGTDASIETPLAQQIASYLEANASQKPRGVAPDDPLRITRSRWFCTSTMKFPRQRGGALQSAARAIVPRAIVRPSRADSTNTQSKFQSEVSS
ncbi:MAG TPA: hypothetical protein VFS24_11630 [Steroidobacteraceae bacterium]|nr:hypothetical protein [Steroidobacteraceae bacterium]